MDKYIGKKLDGRYEIRELIGIGGMANVYKAQDIAEDRVVAVKILREEFMTNEEFVRRFRNESKAISVLSHPNIVRVFDVSFNRNLQSIVMEYIDGITLKQYIEQQNLLSWKSALFFTVQILRALQHAHDKGIVHRDIKPHNIMLLPDGTVKVTDFGIARFARSGPQTITDRAIGSVHYISPEQARGENTDDKADIYSVGVMLYEMLTGKLPFEADSPVSVALKQIQSVAVMPRAINPEIPEGLEEITMRAMQKEPSKRYQSAAEMLKDIEEFKKNPSISFAYKYLTEREVEAEAPPKRKPRTKKQTRKPTTQHTGDVEVIERKSMAIPILAGIAFAFVVVTLFFLYMLYDRIKPFEQIDEVQMPSLVGLDYKQVVGDPQYSNFEIEIDSTEYHAEFARDTIFEQIPRAGRNVKLGTTIKVKVSGGTKILNIPDFKGQDAAAVFSQLSQMGIRYVEQKVNSPTVASGYVIKTNPEAGEAIATGTEITVFVSLGKNNFLVDVPNLLEMTVDEARLMLLELNLRIGNQNTIVSDEFPPGTIVAQDPEPEVKISESSPVNIIVSVSPFMGAMTTGPDNIFLPSGTGEGDELVKLSFNVKLPAHINHLVNVSASQNGRTMQQERLNPAELENNEWKISTAGYTTVMIRIYIDGSVLYEYHVDFQDKSYKRVTDNSSDF